MVKINRSQYKSEDDYEMLLHQRYLLSFVDGEAVG